MPDSEHSTVDERTTIARLMQDKGTDVSTISPNEPVVEAARIMADERIGVLVCCIDPTIVSGVISERDIVRMVARQPARATDILVGDLMTKDVETCRPQDDLRDVMARMKRGGYRHTPVVADGRLRGLVSITDVLNFYIRNTGLGDRQAIIELVFDAGLAYPGG